ncbi:MAG: LuxR C-terminal-related transcriptional regulator [Verrucomicrobiales bacterium]|jgi:DNA-binding NarL/FixJ family response regulator
MTTDQKTRVLIVDDHAMVRLALGEAINQQDDLVLVGEAENGEKALALYRELEPDVMTCDYQLPDITGDQVIGNVISEFPEALLLLLSIFETSESVWKVTEAGALGYVSKAVEIDEMIIAIRTIARGEHYFSEGLEEKLNLRRKEESLSPRELEVLRSLVAGHSNKEIADVLKLSPSTVKHHLEHVFTKLRVNDRTQAVTAAVQRGIVRLA